MIPLDWIAKKISVPKKNPSPSYPPPTPWLGEAELQEKCGESVGSYKIHSCQQSQETGGENFCIQHDV